MDHADYAKRTLPNDFLAGTPFLRQVFIRGSFKLCVYRFSFSLDGFRRSLFSQQWQA